MKTLEKEPDRRYDQASEVRDDVEKAASSDADRADENTGESDDSHWRRLVDAASESTHAVFESGTLRQQVVFGVVTFAAYVAYFFALMCIADAILLFPFCLAVALGGTVLVSWLHERYLLPEALKAVARPLLWASDRLKKISGWSSITKARLLSEDPQTPAVDASAPNEVVEIPTTESKGNSKFGLSAIAALCALVGLLLGFLCTVDDDFALPAFLLLVAGFVLARVRLSWDDRSQLSVVERRLAETPIVICLLALAVVVLSPPLLLMVYWFDHGVSEVQRFLPGNSDWPKSYLAWSAFIISSSLAVGAMWLGTLLLLRRRFPRVFSFLAFPFLAEPPGRWTLIGGITSLLMAGVFAIVSWSIAMN